MGVESQGLEKSRDRYRVIPRTLIFITYDSKVLLLKGARNKRIWPGLYNGVGGHIERDETILESVYREIHEEVGLQDIQDIQLCGVINIETRDPGLGIMVFVFRATSLTAGVRPSSEGSPEWVVWDEIPPEAMVEDLPVLLPHILADNAPMFFARYWYDDEDNLQITFDMEV